MQKIIVGIILVVILAFAAFQLMQPSSNSPAVGNQSGIAASAKPSSSPAVATPSTTPKKPQATLTVDSAIDSALGIEVGANPDTGVDVELPVSTEEP